MSKKEVYFGFSNSRRKAAQSHGMPLLYLAIPEILLDVIRYSGTAVDVMNLPMVGPHQSIAE